MISLFHRRGEKNKNGPKREENSSLDLKNFFYFENPSARNTEEIKKNRKILIGTHFRLAFFVFPKNMQHILIIFPFAFYEYSTP